MANPLDRNARSAGRTRVNACFERRLIKTDQTSIAPPITSTPSDFVETLVLLQDTPREPTSELLQHAAESAFKDGVTHCHHAVEGWEFSVRWSAKKFPYHPDQCLLPRSPMHGVTFAVHQGWLAVDIIAAPADATECDRLNAVGRLLAELINAHTVAVYRPATEESIELSPVVAELLRSGRIGEALTQVHE